MGWGVREMNQRRERNQRDKQDSDDKEIYLPPQVGWWPIAKARFSSFVEQGCPPPGQCGLRRGRLLRLRNALTLAQPAYPTYRSYTLFRTDRSIVVELDEVSRCGVHGQNAPSWRGKCIPMHRSLYARPSVGGGHVAKESSRSTLACYTLSVAAEQHFTTSRGAWAGQKVRRFGSVVFEC